MLARGSGRFLVPAAAAVLLVLLEASPVVSQTSIQPTDIQYLGAFRLPEGTNGTGWYYGGNALAYFPDGDPSGPGDGYPGSLFGTGNQAELYVSEVIKVIIC